jgi:hypothetical protein
LISSNALVSRLTPASRPPSARPAARAPGIVESARQPR